MEYIKLGNTDLNISRICMGCMGFGDASSGQHTWTVDEEHSHVIIRQGLDAGINFLIQRLHIRMEQANSILGKLFWIMQNVMKL